MHTVAFVGLGNMGLPMATRLVRAGHVVRGVDPSPDALEAAAGAGIETTLALGDALAVCLIKARDFKPSDFAQFHPGGMLGRRLLARVADTMITDNLPLIGPEETVREAIFCMTSGRLGLAIITEGDRLLGILTDGDLRRALIMDPTMMDKRVRDFMTPVPVTIGADAMVSDAEILMRKYKIRALVVTETLDQGSERVCGLLEIFVDNER